MTDRIEKETRNAIKMELLIVTFLLCLIGLVVLAEFA